jgi:hypothetical protein
VGFTSICSNPEDFFMPHASSASDQPSRRGFLKAAAAGAVAAQLGSVANVHAAGSDTIKVGVIGCGGRGSGAADNVLHSARNVQIVAVGDVFKFKTVPMRNRLLRLAGKDEI